MPHAAARNARSMPLLAAILVVLGLLGGGASATASPPTLPDVPLIPREVFFANPDRAQVRLSPDGRWISYLAPFNGVLNIWIRPADDDDEARARPLTADRARGIRRHYWASTSRHVIYAQDEQGDENWRLVALDIGSGVVQPLTPPGCQARVVAILPALGSEILVSINQRDPSLHDLHAIDVATGASRLVRIAPPGASDWIVDQSGLVRLVERTAPDAGVEFVRPEPDGSWSLAMTIPPEDAITTRVLGFGPDPSALYLSDSRKRDTAALVRLDLVTSRATSLAAHDRVDLDEVLRHPATGEVQAVAFKPDRLTWTALETDAGRAIQADLDHLRSLHDADFTIASRTLDDQRWLIAYWDDDGPMACYLYDRALPMKDPRRTRFLFYHRDRLAQVPLAPMHAIHIRASDGLPLTAYLTLPRGLQPPANAAPDADASSPTEAPLNLPMVLLVHGGPWARDSWGYNPLHQLLANRGYAVLSVNFRASTGFGKAFVNAGDRQWGARIQDDLTDSVRWAIDQRIADPARIAIVGGSFGGYAAQCGLAFTPDLYACGVSLVGPSDLTTLLESIPPYWAHMRSVFTRRVGDVTTPEGREFLLSRSPLTHAGQIRRPLLLIHGANDPRVRLAESERMARTLDDADIPTALVVFPDEGHGLARPENNLAFIALMEKFLADHLGGRYQPLDDALARSSAQIPIGAARLGVESPDPARDVTRNVPQSR